MTLLGPTRSGKTTLSLNLLDRRRFVVALATKPRDPMIEAFVDRGYTLQRRLPLRGEKVLYWIPGAPELDAVRAEQSAEFRALLNYLYAVGSWTVYIDELQYVCDKRYLGLAAEVELLLQQGGAMDLSLVGGTQRPANVPLAAYSEPVHLWLWKTRDLYNLKRLREVGGAIDPREIVTDLQATEPPEVLYVNTLTGERWATKAPAVRAPRAAR